MAERPTSNDREFKGSSPEVQGGSIPLKQRFTGQGFNGVETDPGVTRQQAAVHLRTTVVQAKCLAHARDQAPPSNLRQPHSHLALDLTAQLVRREAEHRYMVGR